jgi:hypothetical protein
MIGRVFAASLTITLGVGALGAGLCSGSTEAFAKSGGFSFKGSGLSVKGSGLSVRPRHSFQRSMQAPSVFLPPIVPPFSVQNASVAPTRPIRGYRRAYGFDLPAAGIGVYYGPDLFPFDDLDREAFATSTSVRHAAVRRGCGSETHIVPAEDGGERSITIRRC